MLNRNSYSWYILCLFPFLVAAQNYNDASSVEDSSKVYSSRYKYRTHLPIDTSLTVKEMIAHQASWNRMSQSSDSISGDDMLTETNKRAIAALFFSHMNYNLINSSTAIFLRISPSEAGSLNAVSSDKKRVYYLYENHILAEEGYHPKMTIKDVEFKEINQDSEEGKHHYVAKNKKYHLYTDESIPKVIHPMVLTRFSLKGGVYKFVNKVDQFELSLTDYQELSDLTDYRNMLRSLSDLKKPKSTGLHMWYEN